MAADMNNQYGVTITRDGLSTTEFKDVLDSKLTSLSSLVPLGSQSIINRRRCSLRSNVPKLVQSVIFRVNNDGRNLDGRYTQATASYEAYLEGRLNLAGVRVDNRPRPPNILPQQAPPLQQQIRTDYNVLKIELFRVHFNATGDVLDNITNMNAVQLTNLVDGMCRQLICTSTGVRQVETAKRVLFHLVFNLNLNLWVQASNMCNHDDYDAWMRDVSLLTSFAVMWLCFKARGTNLECRPKPIDLQQDPLTVMASLTKCELFINEFDQALSSKVQFLMGDPDMDQENMMNTFRRQIVYKVNEDRNTLNRNVRAAAETCSQQLDRLSQALLSAVPPPGRGTFYSPTAVRARRGQLSLVTQLNADYHNFQNEVFASLDVHVGEVNHHDFVLFLDQLTRELMAGQRQVPQRATMSEYLLNVVWGRFTVDCLQSNNLFTNGGYNAWRMHMEVLISFAAMYMHMQYPDVFHTG